MADGLIFGTGTVVATIGATPVTLGQLTNVGFTSAMTWAKWRGGGSRVATAARLDEVQITGQAEFAQFDGEALAAFMGATYNSGTDVVTLDKDDVPLYASLVCTNPNDGSERKVTFPRVVFNNLSNMNFQQGEFTQPQLQFEVLADADGTVAEFEGFTEVAAVDLTIVAPVGDGSTTPDTGVHSKDLGERVDLVATPDGGKSFIGWIGNVADPAAESTYIIMGKDETVQAVFTT